MSDAYTRLRQREGWAGPDGVEHPGLGGPWPRRLRAARRALADLEAGGLVLDAGAGGGWLQELLPGSTVVAVDLRPVARGRLRLRGDLARLPFGDGCFDAAVYAASLHHVPLVLAISEAARMLRPGGRLIAFDSPVYRGDRAAAAAGLRARGYFQAMGAAELADGYLPIEELTLSRTLTAAGFQDLKVRRGVRHRHLGLITARRTPAATPTPT